MEMDMFGLGAVPLIELGFHQILPGSHNTVILVGVILLGAWALSVVTSIGSSSQLIQQCQIQDPICLEGLSQYRDDFVRLTRSHFSQILALKRTIPPAIVNRIMIPGHLHASSLKLEVVSQPGSSSSGPLPFYRPFFQFDSSVPVSVQLFWGVPLSAVHELLAIPDKESVFVRIPGAPDSDARDRFLTSDERPSMSTCFNRILMTPFRSVWNSTATSRNVAGRIENNSFSARLKGNDVSRSLLEMEQIEPEVASRVPLEVMASYNCTAKSTATIYPQAGLQQEYKASSTDLVDIDRLWVALEGSKEDVEPTGRPASRVPVVVAISTLHPSKKPASSNVVGAAPTIEGFCEVSVGRIRKLNESYSIEIVNQVVLSQTSYPSPWQSIPGARSQ